MAIKKPEDIVALTGEIVKRLNENSRRIRTMEDRMDRMESASTSLEERALEEMGSLKINLEKISNKIGSVADRLTAMENEILRINGLLEKTATKSEIKKLETFIDLVNPVTANFVTRDELEQELEDRLGKK